ncbi:DUF1877 family protein [Plantactinospora siamensis]|uniref:DUF1877 family protein n=1 Tax=Plantactinospora siamensis TaxID=555372 RepID=A0ABV6NPG9_9ACTN
MAAVSLRLRQVSQQDLDRGLGHLESGFVATLDNEVYDAETCSDLLCDLGENWEFVHLAVAGQRHQDDGISGLPVLGGERLGEVGPTDRDLILKLTTDEVAAAAGFLREADVSALMTAHRPLLAERTGGILPDVFLNMIGSQVADLRRFYLSAAEAGRAVVKRSYAP